MRGRSYETNYRIEEMIKPEQDRETDDWAINDEWSPKHGGSRPLNLGTVGSLYGLKSVTKIQTPGHKVRYVAEWKEDGRLTIFEWRCFIDLDPESTTDLSDLESSFFTNGSKQEIDRIKLYIIWEIIERDLLNFYKDDIIDTEFDAYTDADNAQFVKDHPEYANGKAINEAQKEFNDKFPDYFRCPACGSLGPNTDVDLKRHLTKQHADRLGNYTVEEYLKLPVELLTVQDLRDRKWNTVEDIIKGTNGKIVGVVSNIFNKNYYVASGFIFCSRCFYSGVGNEDFHKVFRPSIKLEEVHNHIPYLSKCPQCKRRGHITVVKKLIGLFDFELKEVTSDIRIPVIRCDEWKLKKGHYVVVESREDMVNIRRVQTKVLRCGRVQILTEEIIRNALGMNVRALPQTITVEQKIRKLVFAYYKQRGIPMPIYTVLQEIYNENPDVRSSKIFSEGTTSDNKSLRRFCTSLTDPIDGDDGRLVRVGHRPIVYMWVSNLAELPE